MTKAQGIIMQMNMREASLARGLLFADREEALRLLTAKLMTNPMYKARLEAE